MCDASEIWTGNAGSSDRACPTLPPALLDLLTQLIREAFDKALQSCTPMDSQSTESRL